MYKYSSFGNEERNSQIYNKLSYLFKEKSFFQACTPHISISAASTVVNVM